jgi:hypothetical protein
MERPTREFTPACLSLSLAPPRATLVTGENLALGRGFLPGPALRDGNLANSRRGWPKRIAGQDDPDLLLCRGWKKR